VTDTTGALSTTTDGLSTSAILTGLADYTGYTFTVTATNDAGVGPPGLSNTIATFTFVTTLAGDGDAGYLDGPGAMAQFRSPFGIAVDDAGTLYVGDNQNYLIRKIAPDGTTSTLAGSVQDAGWADGPGATAMFNSPAGVAIDANGVVTVADIGNERVRQVQPDGTTSTLAGSGDAGWSDGVGAAAAFNSPGGVALDHDGNVYVADLFNFRIRKIQPDGTTSTLAGNGDAGWVDGTGGPNGTAGFAAPYGIAVGPRGLEAYVGDFFGNRIRRVALDGGETSTLAGNGDAGSNDGTGGPYGTATFGFPVGVAVDSRGTVYVADVGTNRIRRVAQDGTTSTLAGGMDAGFLDGPAGTALFFQPVGVAVDARGVVYVTEYLNERVRKIIQSSP
jgi:sugar lactone lactonase YvrE